MSVYMTEEEQLESIKKWWTRYGTAVTVFLSCILLAIAGYRYIHWHQDKVTHQASIAFEQMMNAFSNHNSKAVRSWANELIKEYKHTVYADAASLTLARLDVDKENLDKAREELQQIEKNSNMPVLKQIAKIRLARIFAGSKSYDKALEELSRVEDKAWMPVINELKGDIYTATGKYQEAMKAYQLALRGDKLNGMGNLFLQMKANELAAKTQSVA